MNDFDKAISAYGEALKLNPDLLEAYVASGDAYIFQGNFQKAELYLAKADKLKINDAKLRFLQGLVLVAKQNYRAADMYFKKAIKVNPYYGMAYANLGKLSFEQNNIKMAIYYFQRTVSLMPQNKDAILALASLYLRPGYVNVHESYNLYKKALELNPDAPEAAQIRETLKNLEQAMNPK